MTDNIAGLSRNTVTTLMMSPMMSPTTGWQRQFDDDSSAMTVQRRQFDDDSSAMTGSRALAAIDVGTNSVHMVIARPVNNGSSEVLARERMPVRLGSGDADMKTLLPDAIDRAVAALVECRHIAEAHDAEVVAVATSAVREADNQGDFLRRAHDQARVTVQVVSGAEEARLIHLGAVSAVPIVGKPHLVVDIGGGSTELIVGKSTTPVLARSLKLGHIRLTNGFFPAGVINDGAVRACRRHIRSFVAPVAQEARAIGFEIAVGCSGTIASLAYLCAARRGEALRSTANATIERHDLKQVVTDLTARRLPDERLDVPGLDPARRDVIVAGAVLLRQLFKALEIKSMIVSTGALREGLLLDRFNRRDRSRDDGLHHLSDLRRSSVLALARSYHEDLHHAEHATELALQLFDETLPAHGLGNTDSELLEAAGLLHNIGRFVAHSSHHKHSQYLIRNSERLSGFTQNELELVSLVARYHRKSEPLRRHLEFAALGDTDRYRVRVLAGLLRVGIALDRTYRRLVHGVRASVSEETVAITVEAKPGADVDIELYTAGRSAGLLAAALGRELRFQVVEVDPAQRRHRHPANAAGR